MQTPVIGNLSGKRTNSASQVLVKNIFTLVNQRNKSETYFIDNISLSIF